MGKPLITGPNHTATNAAASTSGGLTRRQLLQALAAGAILPSVGCGPLALPEGPFPLGVASGDATSTGALLWTHFAGHGPVSVGVWDGDDTTREPAFLGTAAVDEAGVARVEVGGLRPGSRYSYAFADVETKRVSAVGRFRTAFAPDALERLRVGATCCTKAGRDTAALRRASERSDLDLFLWLGDAVYADGARTVQEYRRKWEATLVDPGHQAVRAAHGLLATWDDHEFNNDHHMEAASAARFEAAAEAFIGHMPMRRLAEAPGRLWRSVRWGRTAEFFVLDCRGERLPSTRLTPQAQYVSPEQLAWLQQGLYESPAVFKVVMTSVPISEFPGTFFQSTVADRWEGFAAQRTALLSFVDEHAIPGVLWVSGDFHLASTGRVSRSGPGAGAIEVLVGPGANFSNPSPTYPGPPQFDWSSGINNFAVFDFDPVNAEVTVEHVDGRGAVLATHRFRP